MISTEPPNLSFLHVPVRRKMEVEKSNRNREESDDHEDVILPGFRFHPTDEELVGFYLRRKIEKKPPNIELIKQIDIYKHDPWDLPKLSSVVGEKEWYFFSLRGRKYRNSIRPNRVTRSGFWKATGIDKPIYSSNGDKTSSECIGLKKSLVYYKGSAGKGTKTDWMMHEFRLPTTTKNNQEAEVWTICRIFKRSVSHKKYIPDWTGSSSTTKQNPTDSSSITCSFESDLSQERQYCFEESMKKQVERNPPLSEETNEFMLVGRVSTSVAQDQSPPLHSAFPNSDADEFYRSGSWDELGAVVEFATDPNFVYGCRNS